MKYYITIDGGTTNTRIMLLQDRKPLDVVRIPLGARASIESKNTLSTEIAKAIKHLLESHALREEQISRVLACGMITSEFGLCNLPHVTAPAGIRELHETMHETVLPKITSIPFVFIRGVKTVGDTLEATDMMRGEESELYGLLSAPSTNTLYVLPGSHSKLIETDAQGRICRFSTMLTGEMLAALSTQTILKDAVDLSIAEIDAQMLSDGCRYALKKGLNEALFKVRILKNLFHNSPVEVYSFFLGAILSAEIDTIVNSHTDAVVIGGKSQIKRATEILLKKMCNKRVFAVDDSIVDTSSAYGMIQIFEYEGV